MKRHGLISWINTSGCALLLFAALLFDLNAQEYEKIPTSELRSRLETSRMADSKSHYIQTNLPYVRLGLPGSYQVLHQTPKGVAIPEETYGGQVSNLRLGASESQPAPSLQKHMTTALSDNEITYVDETGKKMLDSNLTEVGIIAANGEIKILPSGTSMDNVNPDGDDGDPEYPFGPLPIPPCGTCMPSSDYNYSAAISLVDSEHFLDVIGRITSEYQILSDLRAADDKQVAANAFVAEAYLQAGFTFWPVTHAGFPATSSDWHQHFSDWGFEKINPAAPKEGAIVVIDKLMGIYHVNDDGDGFLVHPSENNDGKIVSSPWSLVESNPRALILYPRNFATSNK